MRAAELLTTTWRQTLNAATMLGQSKTVFQAEIDSASELVDFWRFNVAFAQELYAEQPISTHGTWNQSDYRGLEGFVYAVTPFNFTAIGGNLPTAPALMGCTVVWKPASSAMLSAHYIMKLLQAAGLPPGVINFVPGDAAEVSRVVLDHPDFAGVHFTGSTGVFNSIWSTVGQNLSKYRSYPRIVGETGGKDFVVLHPSADPQAAAVALVRGAFEYQGQKCSAASRAYIPKSLWPTIKERMLAMIADIKMGDVRDFRNFMGAVIDDKAFAKISGYIADAKKSATIVAGGDCNDKVGYFVQPTVVQARKPDYRLMCEEIFGPVLTTYVYNDKDWTQILRTVDATSPYALTGSIFATDRRAIQQASQVLRNAAGARRARTTRPGRR
jgi:1-pyrroline-5-carboxylate dehydrogenase